MTLILIGFLNCTFAFGQTYSSVTSDKEIYDFLNWMTVYDKQFNKESNQEQKNIHYKILSWDSANFIAKDAALIDKDPFIYLGGYYLYQRLYGTDTIFKQQDREFLFRQFTAIKDTVWHNRFSNSKLLTRKKQKRPNRYYYSIPLFSLDKNYVIIHRQLYCGGECGHGGYYVYRRIDEKNWVYVTGVNFWIS